MTTLKELLKKREQYEAELIVVQEYIQSVNIEIEHMLAQRLADLRKLQAKEFGAVNLTLDGYKVTETITKKVEWDQEKLQGLFKRISESGDQPSNYMRMKLDIPEKMYGEFPDQIKGIFAEARTIKTGRPTLKFEEVTNA